MRLNVLPDDHATVDLFGSTVPIYPVLVSKESSVISATVPGVSCCAGGLYHHRCKSSRWKRLAGSLLVSVPWLGEETYRASYDRLGWHARLHEQGLKLLG